MSRADVRAAVTQWVETPTIPNLNQVFTSFPKRIQFQQYAAPGQLNRAVAVVFIENEVESRIAVGGGFSGWKRIDYGVVLQLYFHSLENLAENAMDSFDVLVDNIKDQLRSGGHRLNDPAGTTIWQAAEPGIAVSYGEPTTNDDGAIEIWAGIKFDVTQMIQA